MTCPLGVISVHLCVTSYIISIIRERACHFSNLHSTGTISCLLMTRVNASLRFEQAYFEILDSLHQRVVQSTDVEKVAENVTGSRLSNSDTYLSKKKKKGGGKPQGKLGASQPFLLEATKPFSCKTKWLVKILT